MTSTFDFGNGPSLFQLATYATWKGLIIKATCTAELVLVLATAAVYSEVKIEQPEVFWSILPSNVCE